MKVSATTVLLSVSTASAFNVGYLNQLAGTAPSPVKEAPKFKEIVPSGPAGYLDNLKTPELVQAMETAPAPVAAAPAPVAAAPVVAAPAPAVGDYLGALTSGSTATTGAGLTGYLDAMGNGANAISGGGLTGYLDALPSSSTQTSGTGPASYLDSVTVSSPAAPTPATPPAPVAPATPAAGVPVATVAAVSAGDYLGTLAGSNDLVGGGLAGYLDALPPAFTQTSGAGVPAYTDALAVNAGTTGAGNTGYLDALLSNTALTADTTAAPSVTSFLENVYSQIMSLPADQRSENGSTVTFASATGPYAMSFVKN